MRCKARDQSQVPGPLKGATITAPRSLRTRMRSDVVRNARSTSSTNHRLSRRTAR